MTSAHLSRLKKHRRAWALSQRELAMLLGGKSRVAVTLYETQRRKPSLEALISFELIFGSPVHSLFPSLALAVARTVRKNAVRMREGLCAKSDAASVRKCRLLDDLITRSTELLSLYE